MSLTEAAAALDRFLLGLRQGPPQGKGRASAPSLHHQEDSAPSRLPYASPAALVARNQSSLPSHKQVFQAGIKTTNMTMG